MPVVGCGELLVVLERRIPHNNVIVRVAAEPVQAAADLAQRVGEGGKDGASSLVGRVQLRVEEEVVRVLDG